MNSLDAQTFQDADSQRIFSVLEQIDDKFAGQLDSIHETFVQH